MSFLRYSSWPARTAGERYERRGELANVSNDVREPRGQRLIAVREQWIVERDREDGGAYICDTASGNLDTDSAVHASLPRD